MDCSLPGSSVHGIFQARVLEWGVIAFPTPDSNSLYFSGWEGPKMQFSFIVKILNPGLENLGLNSHPIYELGGYI